MTSLAAWAYRRRAAVLLAALLIAALAAVFGAGTQERLSNATSDSGDVDAAQAVRDGELTQAAASSRRAA